MKKIMLSALIISVGSSAIAQKCSEKDLPLVVKNKFATLYPGAKAEKWEKEGGDYEATLDVKKKETTVTFSANGNLIDTETSIAIADLPQSIKEYALKNYPGKKIKEASETIDVDNKATYEVEIHENELIFDENGSFIKSQKETDKD